MGRIQQPAIFSTHYDVLLHHRRCPVSLASWRRHGVCEPVGMVFLDYSPMKKGEHYKGISPQR
ncbi:hypothetical protein DDI_1818 [Dickeya dianthicola RNS04.9]|nr:hypothetical protein DDI_1818 [Dickeya dianthicola RNS04.9]